MAQMAKLQIPFKVTVDDTEHSGVIRTIDAVFMERQTKRPVAHMKEQPFLEGLLAGSYSALKRAGQVNGHSFDEWLEHVDAFTTDVDEEEPEPGETGAG